MGEDANSTRPPLRALLVEDDPNDAELILTELRGAGREVIFQRVETPEQMAAALIDAWDVVISDYSLPAFSAPAAFSMVRERNLDLPFIVVSGAIGDEVAVEAMRIGVHDFCSRASSHGWSPRSSASCARRPAAPSGARFRSSC